MRSAHLLSFLPSSGKQRDNHETVSNHCHSCSRMHPSSTCCQRPDDFQTIDDSSKWYWQKSDPVEDAELDADDDRNIKLEKQGRRLTREAEAQASILNGATGSDAPTDGERALICMSGSPAKHKADSDPQLSQAMAYSPRVNGKQSVQTKAPKKSGNASAPATPQRRPGTDSPAASVSASPKSPRVYAIVQPKKPTRGPASPLHSVFAATNGTKTDEKGTYQLVLFQITPCDCPHVWQNNKHRE